MKFVYESFQSYKGDISFFALFFMAILLILIRKKKEEKIIFIPYLIFLVITVFNFLMAPLISRYFGTEEVYYRFFWCILLVPTVAYMLCDLIFELPQKKQRLIITPLVIIIIALCGKPVLSDVKIATNTYKIPDELFEVCEVLHADHTGEDNPKVAFSYMLNLYARQYDARINLSINRNNVIDVFNVSDVGITEEKRESKSYRMQEILIQVLMQNLEVPASDLIEALEYTKTDYIVFIDNDWLSGTLESQSYTQIAEVDGYKIFKILG